MRVTALLLLGLGLSIFSSPWAVANQPDPGASIRFELNTHRTGQNVAVALSFLDWESRPLREIKPGLYALSLEEPWVHEFEYKFVVDQKWMLDPSNPHTAPDGRGGYNSVKEVESFH